MTLERLSNVAALLLMPWLSAGLILRVKSLWSGRKGPRLSQPIYDVLRLFRKSPVYSETTTPIFRIGPWVYLATALGSAAVVPLLGCAPIASFAFDFVWFAYLGALGRIALMLAALDTGSSFEGMGAAREALFSTLLEPAFFLAVAALCAISGEHTLQGALRFAADGSFLLRTCVVTALLIVLQVEAARMPVDDPSTHLELTMVREVMVLDHSGPDLAAIQIGSAIKLFVGASMIATLLNPWAGSGSPLAAAANVLLCSLVAGLVGAVESLVARLAIRLVPSYIAIALGSGGVAVLLGGLGGSARTMSPLIIALLAALLVPLFVGTWRTSLVGLAIQGLIMSAIAYPGLRPIASAQAWLTLVDLALVRGLLVPLALYAALRAQAAPSRNDVIPPNLFSWTLALGMVLAAFNFSEALVSESGQEQSLVAVAVAGVLLGFLVLASASGPFSQMVGALRIENSIALLELSGEQRSALGLQFSMLALFVATIGFYLWYLATLEPAASEHESAADSLTL